MAIVFIILWVEPLRMVRSGLAYSHANGGYSCWCTVPMSSCRPQRIIWPKQEHFLKSSECPLVSVEPSRARKAQKRLGAHQAAVSSLPAGIGGCCGRRAGLPSKSGRPEAHRACLRHATPSLNHYSFQCSHVRCGNLANVISPARQQPLEHGQSKPPNEIPSFCTAEGLSFPKSRSLHTPNSKMLSNTSYVTIIKSPSA